MYNKEETVLHFVGIGGIGMSGIAEVFLNQGYRVRGSDLVESDATKRLLKMGAKIFLGHKSENVLGSDVVVVSSAVRETNPEIHEAKRLKIPVIPRAEMLGELMRGRIGIAVAGTHGKTTTTSMLATILTRAGLDPTLVVGGKVDSFGGNAKLGQGQYVVAEADESDGSFLHLPATLGIITNIDNDHLDHFENLAAIEDAFVSFVAKLPFYGLVAVCGDDPGIRRCMGRWTKPFLTYGLSEECDVYAAEVTCRGLESQFKIYSRQGIEGERKFLGGVQIFVPGIHNVYNALASISIALRLRIPFETIVLGLHDFRGVKRRFDIRYHDSKRSQAIVDDYGHHPTEIQATLSAARGFWPGRIISVFQPHRFSRTLHCHDGFLSAFFQSDVVLITDLYSAGEDPIPGVNSKNLAKDLKNVSGVGREVIYSGSLEATKKILVRLFTEGDLILCMGAGSITRLPEQLISEIKQGQA